MHFRDSARQKKKQLLHTSLTIIIQSNDDAFRYQAQDDKCLQSIQESYIPNPVMENNLTELVVHIVVIALDSHLVNSILQNPFGRS